jgi:hypothetical protein
VPGCGDIVPWAQLFPQRVLAGGVVLVGDAVRQANFVHSAAQK